MKPECMTVQVFKKQNLTPNQLIILTYLPALLSPCRAKHKWLIPLRKLLLFYQNNRQVLILLRDVKKYAILCLSRRARTKKGKLLCQKIFLNFRKLSIVPTVGIRHFFQTTPAIFVFRKSSLLKTSHA